jgi:hypothetical protein
MCDHLFDTTSRYDHERRLLTFLLLCPVCGTEQLVERLSYEPRFRPDPAAVGATPGG